MNKEAWITVAVIVVLVLVGVGIYAAMDHSAMPAADTSQTDNSGAQNDPLTGLPIVTTTTNSTTTVTTTPTVKSFTVTGKNFSFSPSTMTVNKGDTVKITFVNSAGSHNLKIDEFNVGTKTLSTGQQETITFVADKTGSFQYYCSTSNHRAMGMFGTLSVI
jgi:plastocyanin